MAVPRVGEHRSRATSTRRSSTGSARCARTTSSRRARSRSRSPNRCCSPTPRANREPLRRRSSTLGVQIVVDDFGTTHGAASTPRRSSRVAPLSELMLSLVALEDFPVDVVKVDRELIGRCFADSRDGDDRRGHREARAPVRLPRRSPRASSRRRGRAAPPGRLRPRPGLLLPPPPRPRPHRPAAHDLADAAQGVRVPRRVGSADPTPARRGLGSRR